MGLKDILCKNSSVVEATGDDSMDLYVKAGPDGKSVGDCPFAHTVRMVLHIKRIDCKLHPCSPDAKPDWLIKDLDGKMPCLNYKGNKKIESSVICEYLENLHPNPPLTFEGKEKKALEETSGIFPAMAKMVKSLEFDSLQEKNLLEQLEKFETYLGSKSDAGDYLVGDKISIADCSLAPKLYHLESCLKHYYPDTWEKVEKFEKVSQYMAKMFSEGAFQETKYPADVVIWGWDAHREKIAKNEEVTCSI